MNSSLDSSRWTSITPPNFQQHPGGESQCGSVPDLTRQIVRREIYPTLSGTYSDVWQSTWYDGKRKRDVAVKSLKIPFVNECENSKNYLKLMNKISSWAQLLHKNVLPLYGIAHDFGHFPSLVTPWVNEGSLNDYIANHHLSLRNKLDIVSSLFDENDIYHSCTCASLGQTGSSWPWLSTCSFYCAWIYLWTQYSGGPSGQSAVIRLRSHVVARGNPSYGTAIWRYSISDTMD